jgi:hypothetical protein
VARVDDDPIWLWPMPHPEDILPIAEADDYLTELAQRDSEPTPARPWRAQRPVAHDRWNPDCKCRRCEARRRADEASSNSELRNNIARAERRTAFVEQQQRLRPEFYAPPGPQPRQLTRRELTTGVVDVFRRPPWDQLGLAIGNHRQIFCWRTGRVIVSEWHAREVAPSQLFFCTLLLGEQAS